MSKRYTPEEKAHALARVQANHGNVPLTSFQLGIPTRTLYDWRRQHWLDGQLSPPHTPVRQQRQQQAPPDRQDENAQLDHDVATLKAVRHQIIEELYNVMESLKDSYAVTTPYQRVLVLSQLIDRLIKLDAFIPHNEHEQTIRIEYLYPDGSTGFTPPWASAGHPFNFLDWQKDETSHEEKSHESDSVRFSDT